MGEQILLQTPHFDPRSHSTNTLHQTPWESVLSSQKFISFFMFPFAFRAVEGILAGADCASTWQIWHVYRIRAWHVCLGNIPHNLKSLIRVMGYITTFWTFDWKICISQTPGTELKACRIWIINIRWWWPLLDREFSRLWLAIAYHVDCRLISVILGFEMQKFMRNPKWRVSN